jgi:hypothetical protein
VVTLYTIRFNIKKSYILYRERVSVIFIDFRTKRDFVAIQH